MRSGVLSGGQQVKLLILEDEECHLESWLETVVLLGDLRVNLEKPGGELQGL